MWLDPVIVRTVQQALAMVKAVVTEVAQQRVLRGLTRGSAPDRTLGMIEELGTQSVKNIRSLNQNGILLRNIIISSSSFVGIQLNSNPFQAGLDAVKLELVWIRFNEFEKKGLPADFLFIALNRRKCDWSFS
jgi:hypothetical protein